MTDTPVSIGAVRLIRRGAVADLLLDRPAKRNALTVPMLDQMAEQLRALAYDDTVRVVCVRGAGAAFCAGADLNSFRSLSPQQLWRQWTRLGQETFSALAGLPQTTVAVLSGDALGGGLELAAHCDLRIASRAARLGLPEATLGTMPGWSGLTHVVDLVGLARARLLSLTGRLLTADVAAEWALVDVLAEPPALDDAVSRLVDDLLRTGPAAQRILKAQLAGMGWRRPHSAAALVESLGGAVAAFEGDSTEGVAALLGRRPADWP